MDFFALSMLERLVYKAVVSSLFLPFAAQMSLEISRYPILLSRFEDTSLALTICWRNEFELLYAEGPSQRVVASQLELLADRSSRSEQVETVVRSRSHQQLDRDAGIDQPRRILDVLVYEKIYGPDANPGRR